MFPLRPHFVLLTITVFVVLSFSSIISITAAPWTMNKVLLTNSSGAVCNDGSPAAFYFRPGSGSGASSFVVHLQGGAWCTDQSSCLYRAQSSPELVSSLTYPNTTDDHMYGLFSTNSTLNPGWYNANFAYVMYCSSDSWSGNATAQFSGTLWQFQGHRVIEAVFETLRDRFGLLNADRVLFSGCSAGGQGVVVNIDFVRNLLTSFGLKHVNYAGLADAGWLQNVVPYSPSTTTSIITQMQEGYGLWGGIVNSWCAKSNPMLEYFCYISPYAYPHIRSRIFIQTEQYDTYQVSSNCCSPPFTPSQSEYVRTLRIAFASSLSEIKAPSSVFSGACYHHCLTEDTSFNTIKIKGNTMQQVVTSWYYQDNSAPIHAIATCPSFNCSVGCPESPY